MTAGAAGAALVSRAEEELFPVMFGGCEIWEGLRVGHCGSAGVVLGVERLDAANELGKRVLDSRLVDGRGAKREVEQDLIFLNGGESREESGERGIAVCPA